jgi:Sulphur transport
MAPVEPVSALGPILGYGVYLALGLAFGYILESAGFGDARRLAGQFYVKDLSVVRVMFTAIITAMLLIFLSSSLGILDYAELWVNPTFLLADVVGGLIMGVGFIIGGYCPGTSLCSAATLKIDGVFFVLGALLGIYVFGETADSLGEFYFAGDYGRLTLPDLFGLPTGLVVLLAVALAVLFFVVMDRLKARFWPKLREDS